MKSEKKINANTNRITVPVPYRTSIFYFYDRVEHTTSTGTVPYDHNNLEFHQFNSEKIC